MSVIQEKSVYETPDGQVFDTYEAASAHWQNNAVRRALFAWAEKRFEDYDSDLLNAIVNTLDVHWFELWEIFGERAVEHHTPTQVSDIQKHCLDLPVTELSIGVRTESVLLMRMTPRDLSPVCSTHPSKPLLVGQLVRLHESDLLKIKGFGRESLRDLKRALSFFGLTVGMDVGDWKTPYEREHEAALAANRGDAPTE